MYNQHVIINVATCESARELSTWALNGKRIDKTGLSIFVWESAILISGGSLHRQRLRYYQLVRRVFNGDVLN